MGSNIEGSIGSLNLLFVICEGQLGSFFLFSVLQLLRSGFEFLFLVNIERSKREFRFVLEESSEFEVVFGIEGTLDGDVVLEQFEELLFQGVDFFSNEERVDESKVSIGQVLVIPHLLGHQEGAQDQRTPVGGIQGQTSECDQSVNVD